MITLVNAIIFIVIGSLKEDPFSTGMFGMPYFRGKKSIIRLFLNKKGDILKFALLLFHSFNLEVDVSYCSILSASSIRSTVPTYIRFGQI